MERAAADEAAADKAVTSSQSSSIPKVTPPKSVHSLLKSGLVKIKRKRYGQLLVAMCSSCRANPAVNQAMIVHWVALIRGNVQRVGSYGYWSCDLVFV